HEDWKFNPGPSGASLNNGGTIQIRSDGGERHTFTKVAQYGGGLIAAFNAAVGNAPTRPEGQTTQNEGNANIRVGQDTTQQFTAGTSPLFPKGQHLYQCCFHPWMRTVITVR